jgi:hypothetical protein
MTGVNSLDVKHRRNSEVARQGRGILGRLTALLSDAVLL